MRLLGLKFKSDITKSKPITHIVKKYWLIMIDVVCFYSLYKQWKHIASIAKKYREQKIGKLSYKRNKKTLSFLSEWSFVQPHLDYGNVIYDQPNSSKLPDKIEFVQ